MRFENGGLGPSTPTPAECPPDTQLTKSPEYLRWRIVREWRAAGRFDFTESELAAEIARRVEKLKQTRSEVYGGQMPLFDADKVARETRKEACQTTRESRIARRAAIINLLEAAGREGMTRGELATELGVESSGVCQPVSYLLARDLVCQPFKRLSKYGNWNAVIVLVKHARANT